MKKTIGKAPCPLCASGPHPVKISDSGNLYMVCPPPAEGGCKSQFFCRDAHSNRLLAQSITEWSIPKEERKQWVGTAEQPEPDSDDLEDEIEEAIEEGDIEVMQPPSPPPPPPRRKTSSTLSPQPKPPAAPKPKRRTPPPKSKTSGFKLPWEM